MWLQRARKLRVMDFGPPSWDAGGLWPLQVRYPPAATITSPAADAPAHGRSQQSPTAVRIPPQQPEQRPEQEVEAGKQPLRTRLRGAKRKAGADAGAEGDDTTSLPAELLAETGPAERHSSLDRHRVSAPALRTMR